MQDGSMVTKRKLGFSCSMYFQAAISASVFEAPYLLSLCVCSFGSDQSVSRLISGSGLGDAAQIPEVITTTLTLAALQARSTANVPKTAA
jgi:hypothetical protein